MDDMISRQAAIDAITARADRCAENFSTNDPFWEGLVIAKSIVKGLPSVQASTSVHPERKKGKWITETINSYTKRTYCSLCDEEAPFIFKKDDKYNYWYHESKLTNYCPNCGSDNRGEQDG